jgi:cell division septation protein DedD
MLSTMTKARLRLPLTLISLLILANQGFGQVSAVTNSEVRPVPEVAIEAKVLGIPASALSQLGLVLPESAPGGGPMGFAVVLPEGEAKTLTEDARTKPVHSLQLKGSSGNVLKFRVDTRALANPNSPAENPPYFEVGLAFEVTPSVFPSRRIALSTTSVVQIRRGPRADGQAPPLFETQPIKHDIQIPEGKTILLGGFLSASNSSGLPVVPMIAGNPILGYVLSKSPRTGDDLEIVVLLMPRLSGAADAVTKPPPGATVASEPVVKAEAPSVPSPAVTANPLPGPDIFAVRPPRPVLTTPPNPVPPASPPAVSTPAVKLAPPPPPVETPKPVSPAAARFYTVQVGAFGSSDNAETLVVELKKKFPGVFVDKATSGTTPYRVRVGRLVDLAAARQLQSKLTEQGFDSFVVLPDSPQ